MLNRLAPALLALLALGFHVWLGVARGSLSRLSGDEATYVAMTQSLALDGDLRFEAEDRERLAASDEIFRKSVILQRVPSGISYSKPVVFPLLASPFYCLFGENGMVVFNVLCLAGALWLVRRRLGEPWRGTAGALTLVTWVAASIVLPYVVWKTGDLLQTALVLAGLSLALGAVRGPSGDQSGLEGRRSLGAPVAGALLLGLLVSLRLSNALIAVAPLVALWLARHRRQALAFAAALGVTVLAAAGLTHALAGAPSPYRAVRATFNPHTGYPIEEEAPRATPRFDRDRATYGSSKRLVEAPLASAYGAAYFVVGRHTGLLPYFPLALLLLLPALRAGDTTTRVILTAVALLGAFYLVYLPFNYFGGAACVGNRYFLVGYAALLFALRRPLSRRVVVAAWLVALLFGASAVVSVAATSEREASTQNHAYSGLFRRLPYESTSANMDGARTVFWIKEYARFVDPYVDVAPWSFRLRSTDPLAELEVANRRRDPKLRFLVVSEAPKLDLIYSDWARRVRIPLQRPLGKRGLVEIEPSRPLRYHPLWFRNVWDHGLPYTLRVFRLGVRTPDGGPAEAEIRYLGLEPWPDQAFSRDVIEARLPETAVAGSSSRVAVRLTNTSGSLWRSQGVFPVYLSYRLESEAGGSIEGPRTAVGYVAPGGEVRRDLAVSWPREPGRYRLTVDLLVEGVAWFGDRLGAPVGTAVVAVSPAAGSSE